MNGLTADQARHVERAREVLGAEHGYDAAGLGHRIGALEWHLGEMLALVAELSGSAS